MAEYMYVDDSNLWIEGMRVAAVHNRLAYSVEHAMQEGILEHGWMFDFYRLKDFAFGSTGQPARAVVYGSRTGSNQEMWKVAERSGFEVKTYDREPHAKEKKVDTSMSVDMVMDAFRRMCPGDDTVTIFAGDADYVPAVCALKTHHLHTVVCFWDHASRELKEECDEFIALDPYLDYHTLGGLASMGRIKGLSV